MPKLLLKLRLCSVTTAVVVIFATVVTGYFSPAPAAEEEMVKKLVGRWEGKVITPATAENDRVLIISSVKPDGDHWTAVARFGTPQNQGRLEMKVTVSGNDVIVDFDTFAKQPVHLKLEGDNELNGHVRGVNPTTRSYMNINLNLKKGE